MFNFLRRRSRRLFVIGLDCAPPELVFHRWRRDLPNLDRLMRDGAYGAMRSCIPCITVPAWSVMASGKDPGTLGIYGFRNRIDHSYRRMAIATGAAVREPRVWDLLGRAGKRVVTIGVPGTYPPRPVNGAQIGCFLTPETVSDDGQGNRVSKVFTHPPELSAQVNAWAGGEYPVDVRQFRTEDKDFLLRQIYEVTRLHFEVVRQMVRRQPWDFFMFVEMGVDRIHHGFWRYCDPAHRKYAPGNRYEYAIRDYYSMLDGEIGGLLGMLDSRTAVVVVSDHGAVRMDGGICINEWLLREGWLALDGERPGRPTPIDAVGVDWPKTKAWGEGGYYGRVFLNVRGREPQGAVPQADYGRVRDELAEKIEGIRGPGDEDIRTRVYKPEKIYRRVNGIAPDLIVYFGGLRWRSVGSLGHTGVWTFENDTGPDDANHAEQGIFICCDAGRHPGGGELDGVEIVDFAPTVMDYFGLPIPPDMQGRAIPFG